MRRQQAALQPHLRHVFVRLGGLFHDQLRARDADGDALRLQCVKHLLRTEACSPREGTGSRNAQQRWRTWYSSLFRELLRLRALPAPWHVLRRRNGACSAEQTLDKSGAVAPPKRLLHPLLGACEHVATCALQPAYVSRAAGRKGSRATAARRAIVPPIITGWPVNW